MPAHRTIRLSVALLRMARRELSADARQRLDYLDRDRRLALERDVDGWLTAFPTAMWVPEHFGEFVEWLDRYEVLNAAA